MPSPTLAPSSPTRTALIGLVGKKRAGKDSVAARLVAAHGFTRHAFADLLRTAALGLDPIILPDPPTRLAALVNDLGWEDAKDIPEVRRTLQRYGVAMRAVDPTLWIRPVFDAIRHSCRPAVITDVRFPNEADAVERAGGTLVRVIRPIRVSNDLHVSETALDHHPISLVIDNSGTVSDLERLVDDLVNAHRLLYSTNIEAARKCPVPDTVGPTFVN